MAITTVQQAIQGMRPPIAATYNHSGATFTSLEGYIWTSFWYVNSGYPVAATVNSSGLAGQALTSSSAQIPFTNPTTGNSYLARVVAAPQSAVGYYGVSQYVVDRLWENSGVDTSITSAQTINSVPWPSRDIDGSTNGRGVYIALEISASSGFSAAGTATISYTNSDGVSGRTAGLVVGAPDFLTARTALVFFGLDSGDTGVRSIQSITFSAGWTSGSPVVNLIAVRPVVINSSVANNILPSIVEDIVNMAAPKLWNNSVLMQMRWVSNSATLTAVSDTITYQFTEG